MPGPFPFFARGEDLEPGAFWRVTGDHGNPDAGARDLSTSGMTAPAPIYAIADGVVVAAWRNAPENPDVGVHPGRTANPPTIARSGNFLVVETDGHIVLYAHLRSGSIPQELCPFEDAFMSNADDKTSGLPNESIIPQGQRPSVHEGQFLGLLGDTGASSGPHIHIHLKPFEEGIEDEARSIHLRYKRAWVNPNPGSNPLDQSRVKDWKQLDDQHVDKGDAIWPSPLLRWDTAVGERASDIALDVLGSRAVTAIRQANGSLRLDVWRLTTDGWKRGDSETAGTVHEIALTRAGPATFGGIVTALRDGAGNLKLITYQIQLSPDGEKITRAHQDVRGPATQIAVQRITQTDFNGVIAAMRDGDSNLRLITWAIGTNGELEQRGTAVRGPVSRVAITNAFTATHPSFDGVVTAVRDSEGGLRLLTFAISDGGRTISPRHVETAGKVDQVAIHSFDHDRLMVAMRDGDGNLRVIQYDIEGDGSVERRGMAVAGPVSEIALSQAHHFDGIVTAVRDGDGKLRVIPWEARGNRIVRISGAAAGAAARIAIDRSDITIDGRNYLVTALCDGDGNLRLISWNTNF